MSGGGHTVIPAGVRILTLVSITNTLIIIDVGFSGIGGGGSSIDCGGSSNSNIGCGGTSSDDGGGDNNSSSSICCGGTSSDGGGGSGRKRRRKRYSRYGSSTKFGMGKTYYSNTDSV